MNVPHIPAQSKLVHQFLDWGLVERRLRQYPAIGRSFSLKLMKNHNDRPPYYCHYMAWRLGTWNDTSLFARIDELLCCAEKLPDWSAERALLTSTDFAEFWSLVWQLQVAEYLLQVGSDVRWAKSGPDLSVQMAGERWYVECYTPRKSFGLMLFLEDLLGRLDSHVRVSYDLCLPFQLPQDLERTAFLDELLSRFLLPNCIENAKRIAKMQYPVVLYKCPSSSLFVYVDGPDVEAYAPGIVPNVVGSPAGYVEQVLKEAVSNKMDSNRLRDHRPNLLVVNYLLSQDFQLAMFSGRTPAFPSAPPLGANLDALGISVIGIDEKLTKDRLRMIGCSSEDRETLLQIGSFG